MVVVLDAGVVALPLDVSSGLPFVEDDDPDARPNRKAANRSTTAAAVIDTVRRVRFTPPTVRRFDPSDVVLLVHRYRRNRHLCADLRRRDNERPRIGTMLRLSATDRTGHSRTSGAAADTGQHHNSEAAPMRDPVGGPRSRQTVAARS